MKVEYSWTELYRAAIIETDDKMLRTRLHAAKAAIDDRLHELQLNQEGTPGEQQAIIDALSGLNVLRGELEIRSRDKSGDA